MDKNVALIIVLSIFVVGCTTEQPKTQMANPASVFCEEQGHRLEIRDGEGGQYGVCIFDDGEECEEWAFFREECGQKYITVERNE